MSCNNTISIRRRRGLMITDAVIGLSVLAALLAITAITVGHDQRATRAAQAHRQLTFEAEAALLALQAGELPGAPADPSTALFFTESQADAPPGTKWITVVAKKDDQSSELVGLVPADALTPKWHSEPSIERGGQP